MNKAQQELLFLLGFPVLFFLFILFGYDFNGLWGQDAHSYYQYATSLKEWMTGQGTKPTEFFWPVLYPLIAAVLSFLPGSLLFWLQFTSVLSLSGILFFMKRILNLEVPLYRNKTSNYLFLVVALSPVMLRSSVFCMSDMTALFFLVAFWYFCLHFIRGESTWSLVWAAFFAALSINVRYGSAVLVLPGAVTLAVLAIRYKVYSRLAIAPVVAILPFLPNFFIKEGATGFADHSFLHNWSFLNFFKSGFETSLKTHNFLFPNIVFQGYIFVHPIFFVLGLPILFSWKRHYIKALHWLVPVTVLVYLLFLAGIQFQNKRYIMMVLPLVALLYFKPYHRLVEIIADKLKLQFLFVIGVIFVQFGIFTYSFHYFLQRNRLEQRIAKVVKTYPQKHLYGFDMDISLKSYDCNKKVLNLWESEYDRFKHQSLVLFNVDKMRPEWAGSVPMKNWNRMNENYSVQPVHEFANGWMLYEIQ